MLNLGNGQSTASILSRISKKVFAAVDRPPTVMRKDGGPALSSIGLQQFCGE